MQEKDAIQPLAVELPLPGKETGDQDRNGHQRCRKKIVVGGRGQQALLLPLGQKIERHPGQKQRDWEMNQYDVLSVFCE
jgi:hypothetical protein